MSKGSKFIMLVLMLLVPVAIFIFLRIFGENKFDVPIQYAQGLNLSDCPDGGQPHKIPAVDSLGLSGGSFHLIYNGNDEIVKEELNELRRISTNNPEVDIVLLFSDEADTALAGKYRQDNWHINKIKKPRLEELNYCGFGNIDTHSLILTDAQRHIRGFYDIKEKKELDRLEGEIKILRK